MIKGMTAFWVVWAGQLVSVLGSSMTQFALTLWVYQQTAQATALAMIGVFYIIPLLLMTPFSGMMVDRFNRKHLMILSDIGAGVITITLLALYADGRLAIWHLFAASALNGVFQSVQWPAYSAALTLMIPKEQYVRANSLRDIVAPGSNILAPLLAGTLIGTAAAARLDGLRIIFLIDILTFSAAIAALTLIHVPPAPRTKASDEASRGSFLIKAVYGFRYIADRPSLLGLQLFFMQGNLLLNIGAGTLIAPLILARSGNNAWLFGIVQMAGAVGAVAGGLIIGAWGGFRHRMHGVLIGWVWTFLLSCLIVGLGRMQPAWMIGLWIGGNLLGWAGPALIDSSNEAIWMAKVDPGVQGRVYAARSLIAYLAMPLAGLIAGPLADQIMEPAMREGGSLAGVFGWLVGTGHGAGISLILILTGLLGVVISAAAYLIPVVRDAETLMPDHQVDATSE